MNECQCGALTVGAGTQMTGQMINHGTPLPVTHKINLGNNIWIVGVFDVHLKMVKIEITGTNTFIWKETRYTTGTGITSACRDPITFSEVCFTGTNHNANNYPVNLVTFNGLCLSTTGMYCNSNSCSSRPSIACEATDGLTPLPNL